MSQIVDVFLSNSDSFPPPAALSHLHAPPYTTVKRKHKHWKRSLSLLTHGTYVKTYERLPDAIYQRRFNSEFGIIVLANVSTAYRIAQPVSVQQ